MSSEEIPEDVRRFIASSIPSVPYLEAILLLREAKRWWEIREVTGRLHARPKVVLEILEELCAVGIATKMESKPYYQYLPNTVELRHMLDRVANAYRQNLIEVTNVIHSETGRMAQHFVDAFNWRKRE